MHTLVFDRRDISLEYENSCLIIREPNTPPRTLPLSHISKVMCLHSVQLTTSLLGQLWQRGIDFVVLNSRYSERSLGLYPHQQHQVERRCVQYRWQQDTAICLTLAIELCRHRIRHFIRLLPPGNTHLCHCMEQFRSTMQLCQNLEELRGAEGAAQRMIFDYWRNQLPANLGFHKRQRRPPPDPVNALLSLTYTLVMQEAIRQCTAAALDSQLGFYHRTAFGRHSLACDIMEPVRPAVESQVMNWFISGLFNLRHFTPPDTRAGACMLGKAGREIFYRAVDPCMNDWQRQLKATARWISRNIELSRTGDHHDPNPLLAPDSI